MNNEGQFTESFVELTILTCTMRSNTNSLKSKKVSRRIVHEQLATCPNIRIFIVALESVIGVAGGTSLYLTRVSEATFYMPFFLCLCAAHEFKAGFFS